MVLPPRASGNRLVTLVLKFPSNNFRFVTVELKVRTLKNVQITSLVNGGKEECPQPPQDCHRRYDLILWKGTLNHNTPGQLTYFVIYQ